MITKSEVKLVDEAFHPPFICFYTTSNDFKNIGLVDKLYKMENGTIKEELENVNTETPVNLIVGFQSFPLYVDGSPSKPIVMYMGINLYILQPKPQFKVKIYKADDSVNIEFTFKNNGVPATLPFSSNNANVSFLPGKKLEEVKIYTAGNKQKVNFVTGNFSFVVKNGDAEPTLKASPHPKPHGVIISRPRGRAPSDHYGCPKTWNGITGKWE